MLPKCVNPRFFAYLCHILDEFACLDLQHLGQANHQTGHLSGQSRASLELRKNV